MAESTSLNIRKPIVALKTLAYYLYLSIFPNRLGLYHKWGFHYDKKMELWDWRAIVGLIFIGASLYIAPVAPIEVRLGIVWFLCFLLLFLNWITAQQWVTERYLYIPVIGLCLIASFYLQAHLTIYFLILGLLMGRSLMHMPTYENELKFYLSNSWNFPNSEVAFGNLGVTYSRAGLSGAANDMWVISTSINPEYDVPQYNIHLQVKGQGFQLIQNGSYDEGLRMLSSSLQMLHKILKCKVVHFPEAWNKERVELESIIANPLSFLMNEFGRLQNLKSFLNVEFAKAPDQKRKDEVQQSININDQQISNLMSYLSSKGVHIEYNPEKALMSKLMKGAQ